MPSGRKGFIIEANFADLGNLGDHGQTRGGQLLFRLLVVSAVKQSRDGHAAGNLRQGSYEVFFGLRAAQLLGFLRECFQVIRGLSVIEIQRASGHVQTRMLFEERFLFLRTILDRSTMSSASLLMNLGGQLGSCFSKVAAMNSDCFFLCSASIFFASVSIFAAAARFGRCTEKSTVASVFATVANQTRVRRSHASDSSLPVRPDRTDGRDIGRNRLSFPSERR